MRGHADVQVLERRERLHRPRRARRRRVDQVRVHVRARRHASAASRASRRCRSPSSTIARRRRNAWPIAAACRSKQLQLGSRDAVPRQMADRVEQRRAERVVEESRRQLPRLQLQVEPSGLRELALGLRGRREALAGRVATGRSLRLRCRVFIALLDRPHAAEGGVDVGIVGPEPVAEAAAHSVAAVAGDAPFITKCWPSKKSAEYSGYDAIGWNPGNGANDGGRPLPAVADQVVHAPRALARGMRADRHGIPGREVEEAARRIRRRIAPRVAAVRVPRVRRRPRADTRLRSAAARPSSARRPRPPPG